MKNAKIEFLAEGFNIFNRTQVTGVNNRMYVLSASRHERRLVLSIQRSARRVTFRMAFSSANVRFS